MNTHDIYYQVMEVPQKGIISNLAVSNSLLGLSEEMTINDTQRLNLIRLAYFLHSHPIPDDKFNMSVYCNLYEERPTKGTWLIESYDVYQAKDRIERCGTCGCAVGWAPFAGIETPNMITSSWVTYAYEAFGEKPYNTCFKYSWPSNKQHTASRILWCALTGSVLKDEFIDRAQPLIELGVSQFDLNWKVVKEYLDSVTETTQSPSPEQASQLDSIRSSLQG